MKEKALVLFTFATILLLAFLKLGQHPLSEWDEARRGINAIEMLRTGDPINLYFCGELDTWNNKPPLVVWLEAISFKTLGFNELALRLPSALAIVVAFIFLFKIITRYRSATFAALTCLLLASVKGLIGWHVGRTGDTDALLTLFGLASVYWFLLFLDIGKKWAAIPFGLCLGLAFLTKGTAAYTLLPGMALYAIFAKQHKSLLASKAFWGALGLALAFPIAWYFVHQLFGMVVDEGKDEANAFHRQFSVDLWKRFTQPADGWKEAFDPSFFFYSLDKSFNLWNWVFLGFLAFGLFWLAKNRAATTKYMLKNERNRLLLLSLCLYLPLVLFLVIAAKSNRWYLAPALPFVGIATFWGIRHFWNKAVWVKWAFVALLAFTLCRQFWLFWQVPPRPELVTRFAPVFAQAETIVVASPLEQDLLCYLYFFGKEMRFTGPSDSVQADEVLVVKRQDLPKNLPSSWHLVADVGESLIFTAKK